MDIDPSQLTEQQVHDLMRSLRLSETSHPASPWMTPQQAADYLGIALGTLRNWTSARFIPFSKKGRVVRYNRAAIDRWLGKGGCAGRATLADV